MKRINLIRGAAVLIATAALSPLASAQTTVTTTTAEPTVAATTATTTTTTRVGRVGTISPDTLMMEAASGTEPVPYVRTSRTVFVDETGATVSPDLVRAGVPVTVHYTRDADRYLADRVIVQRKTVVAPQPTTIQRETIVEKPVRPPAVIRKEATTTTTTTEPAKVRVVEDEDDDD